MEREPREGTRDRKRASKEKKLSSASREQEEGRAQGSAATRPQSRAQSGVPPQRIARCCERRPQSVAAGGLGGQGLGEGCCLREGALEVVP